MVSIEIFFWLAFFIVWYAFIGYGILITLLVKLKTKNNTQLTPITDWLPVTLVIPCFNEADIINLKIQNCLALAYPTNKLKIVFITDGSTDNSGQIIAQYPEILWLHSNAREGKSAAENRAMLHVKTPVVVFTDANTTLNTDALKNIVRHFYNPKVGCVSGEKRVITEVTDGANATESLYWKYESYLKKKDSDFYTAVGAAGELVAFRTSLYQPMPHDTLLDDFIQSMQIAANGYKIVYEPEAYAMETPSANIKEEIKRKVRICAGGWQSMVRLWPYIAFAKNWKLAFQYYSHRVLRWTVVPFLLIIMLVFTAILAFNSFFYALLCFGQIAFYTVAILGYLLEQKNIRFKLLYVPFYFCMMNWAVLAGLKRYLNGQQSAIWEKAARK
jgi:poly-beta-1,6-N-acetyl-D-glucosamine synthase